MNDVGSWATGLSDTHLVSETEVRTKVVAPLLEFLGYPEAAKAEEFPIFGYEGRKPLHARRADVVLFDSEVHHRYREQADRGWVEDHTLLVLELKKPGESLEDARGQVQFYARWAKVPFYALTDGLELLVFRMQGLFDDVREFACPVAEIPRHWARLRDLLGYESVRRYCDEHRIKSRELPAAGYSDYLRALLSELAKEAEASMERAVSSVRTDSGEFSSGELLKGGSSGVFPGPWTKHDFR